MPVSSAQSATNTPPASRAVSRAEEKAPEPEISAVAAAEIEALQAQLDAARTATENAKSESAALPTPESGASIVALLAAERRAAELERKVSELQSQIESLQEELESAREAAANAAASAPAAGGATPSVAGGRAAAAAPAAAAVNAAAKARQDAKESKDAEKMKKLEEQVRTLKTQLKKAEDEARLAGAQSSQGSKEMEKALRAAEKKVTDLEKKQQKALDEQQATFDKQAAGTARQLAQCQRDIQELQANLEALTKERDALQREANKLGSMSTEMETLRAQAARVDDLTVQLAAMEQKNRDLDEEYRKEVVLRKRYWNMMEDMKGKIRVYCRCRPMSGRETAAGNTTVVTFPDDVTVEVAGPRGARQFTYDQCFSPAVSQAQVFADTANLMQSAFDGYNVCIFAYGQTGSGKTFTMTGSAEMPGLTPRAVAEIFRLIDENKKVNTCTVKAYMVELYNDNVIDLFWKLDNAKNKSAEPPKLDIKQDTKGMVFVRGATIKECPDVATVMNLFNAGNAARHVGATNMNAESSRSHLVFSLLIENYNRQTKKNWVGKLSMVDLAGSERVGKTGATEERLREAQYINKSLSALSNVISALSTNAKHVPFRNDKLTLLMQDSLGGNAKTLMFVNISPADYNAEETTTSLMYASRVKLITNKAEKNTESAEIARLKKVIADLRAGGAGNVEDDGPADGGAAGGAEDGATDMSQYNDGPVIEDMGDADAADSKADDE